MIGGPRLEPCEESLGRTLDYWPQSPCRRDSAAPACGKDLGKNAALFLYISPLQARPKKAPEREVSCI